LRCCAEINHPKITIGIDRINTKLAPRRAVEIKKLRNFLEMRITYNYQLNKIKIAEDQISGNKN
jgi:hypothetical protein